MRGSAGGKARAILQKAEAQQRKLDYLQDPKICEFCRNPIPLNGNIPSIVRSKRYCNNSCAASAGNRGKKRFFGDPNRIPKSPKLLNLSCKECKEPFQAVISRVYCSKECRKIGREKSIDVEVFRTNRRRQMKQEEDVANNLRAEGWEILYTSNCCDRIGIKDGKPYFLEFKLEGREELRTGQKRLSEVAGEQFKVVVHDISGRRVERSTDGS